MKYVLYIILIASGAFTISTLTASTINPMPFAQRQIIITTHDGMAGYAGEKAKKEADPYLKKGWTVVSSAMGGKTSECVLVLQAP